MLLVHVSAEERLALVHPREYLAERQIKKLYLDPRKTLRSASAPSFPQRTDHL